MRKFIKAVLNRDQRPANSRTQEPKPPARWNDPQRDIRPTNQLQSQINEVLQHELEYRVKSHDWEQQRLTNAIHRERVERMRQAKSNAEVEKRVTELSTQNTEFSIRLLETCNKLRQVKVEARRRITNLRVRNGELSAQNDELLVQTQNREQHAVALKESNDKITLLEKDNAVLQKELKHQETCEKLAKHRLNGLRTSYDNILLSVAEMAEDLGISERMISESETRNSRLSNALREAQKREEDGVALHEDLRTRLMYSQKENHKLQSELKRRATSELEVTQKLHGAIERERRNIDECESLRKRVTDQEHKTTILARDNAKLKTLLSTAQDDKSLLKGQVVELEKQVADLTSEADSARGFERGIVEAFKCGMAEVQFR